MAWSSLDAANAESISARCAVSVDRSARTPATDDFTVPLEVASAPIKSASATRTSKIALDDSAIIRSTTSDSSRYFADSSGDIAMPPAAPAADSIAARN